MKTLDLNKLRELSVARAKEGFKTYDNVSILFFTTAIAGEVGELCNMVKKLERVKAGGLDAGTNEKAADITASKLKEEMGGIVIYLDLLASRYGINLSEAVIDTFNEKSEKYNLDQFLPEQIDNPHQDEHSQELAEIREYAPNVANFYYSDHLGSWILQFNIGDDQDFETKDEMIEWIKSESGNE